MFRYIMLRACTTYLRQGLNAKLNTSVRLMKKSRDKMYHTLTQKLLQIGKEKVTDWWSVKNNNTTTWGLK